MVEEELFDSDDLMDDAGEETGETEAAVGVIGQDLLADPVTDEEGQEETGEWTSGGQTSVYTRTLSLDLFSDNEGMYDAYLERVFGAEDQIADPGRVMLKSARPSQICITACRTIRSRLPMAMAMDPAMI